DVVARNADGVAGEIADRSAGGRAGRDADRTADQADHSPYDRADAGVAPALIADAHFPLQVLGDDGVRLDPLAGAALVRVHRLVHLRRRILAVVDRVDQRFRLLVVRGAQPRNAPRHR